MEARLQERLGTRVHVRNGQNYRGSILIEYYERADLERILELVAPKPQLDAPGDSAEMDITSELKDTLVPRS
jgi:hypothetical protein